MKVIDIGKLIQSERKKKGMTQADLAYDLCTVATLSRIENGLHIPKNNVLFGLLDRLEISEYKLLGPMFDDSDFDTKVYFLKDRIEELCSNDNWEDFRTSLDNLKALNIDYNPTDKQFIIVYEAIYNYENDRKKLINHDELLSAITLTISEFTIDAKIDFNLTLYEQYLLIFMAYCMILNGNPTSAASIIGNLETSFKNTVSLRGHWSKPVLYYYEMLAKYYLYTENYEAALEAIDERNNYCCKQRLYSKLCNNAYEKTLCHVKLEQTDAARKTVLENYFHLLGIKKTDEAEAFRQKVKDSFSINFKITERRTK